MTCMHMLFCFDDRILCSLCLPGIFVSFHNWINQLITLYCSFPSLIARGLGWIFRAFDLLVS